MSASFQIKIVNTLVDLGSFTKYSIFLIPVEVANTINHINLNTFGKSLKNVILVNSVYIVHDDVTSKKILTLSCF